MERYIPLYEMAKPSKRHKEKVYYHGTESEKSALSILKKGINPPDLELRTDNSLIPRKGKVYITSNLGYALIYTFGANRVGEQMEKGWWKRYTGRGQYGYIFEISGKNLKDIEPDEDSIGEMISNKKPLWLYKKAKEIFEYGLLNPEQDFNINIPEDIKEELELFSGEFFRGIMQGEYSFWAFGGKILLDYYLTDEEKIKLIDEGSHIAHTGTLKPSKAWKINLDLIGELKSNGSNFFKYAERIK